MKMVECFSARPAIIRSSIESDLFSDGEAINREISFFITGLRTLGNRSGDIDELSGITPFCSDIIVTPGSVFDDSVFGVGMLEFMVSLAPLFRMISLISGENGVSLQSVFQIATASFSNW
jgi:hypothetical protein